MQSCHRMNKSRRRAYLLTRYGIPGLMLVCAVTQAMLGLWLAALIVATAAVIVSLTEARALLLYSEGTHRGRAEMIELLERAAANKDARVALAFQNPQPWDDWQGYIDSDQWRLDGSV
jgi:hypothetical protein